LAGGSPRNLIYVDGEPNDKLDNKNLVDDLEKLIRTKASQKQEQEKNLIAKS